MNEYLSSDNIHKILGKINPENRMFKNEFLRNMKLNFENLQNNKFVTVEKITINKHHLNTVKEFFSKYDDEKKLEEFFIKKHTKSLNPSLIDLMLISLSKEIETTLISNDYDITFFRDELVEKKLAHEIIRFDTLKYDYN